MGPFIIILKVILLNKLTHYAKLKFQSIIIMVALTNKMSNSCMRLRLFMIACVIATGLAKCRCHGTFEVCTTSGKSEETCDAYHSYGREYQLINFFTAVTGLGKCELTPCTYCDESTLHFDPRRVCLCSGTSAHDGKQNCELVEHRHADHFAILSCNGTCAEHVSQNDPDLPSFSPYGAYLFVGAPISRDDETVTFKFRVNRLGGHVGIGFSAPNYYYDSEGNMHEPGREEYGFQDGKLTTGLPKFIKGSEITVSLGSGELIYSHNGKEVHRSVLPELDNKYPRCPKCDGNPPQNTCDACDGTGMGKFQLCVRVEDAKVTLLDTMLRPEIC